MGYVTPEQITQAKELDLLTYIQRYDPHALVHVGGNTYCTPEHGSLKISNGKWNWVSRGIGGKTALDYLIKVQSFSFTQAVEAHARQDFSPLPHVPQAQPKSRNPGSCPCPSPAGVPPTPSATSTGGASTTAMATSRPQTAVFRQG